MTKAELAFAAMQKFCDRVDRGEVRSKRTYAEFKEILSMSPTVGDGSGDAALAIAEHAFKAGYSKGDDDSGSVQSFDYRIERAWDRYDPPEDIKALS